MDALYTKQHIRAALDTSPTTPEEDMQWLAAAPPDVAARVRATLPTRRTPAAVLVPLVEHKTGMTVLLTQRATTLKDHAGQISFPGGRIEPDDHVGMGGLKNFHRHASLLGEIFAFVRSLPRHRAKAMIRRRNHRAS